jgi:predicted nucleic acid-binding protein
MRLYVLDASAWLRLFLGDGPAVPGLTEAALMVERGSAAFIAPELVVIEVAHALIRKVRLNLISLEEQQQIWLDMRSMPMELCGTEQHVESAIQLALTHNLSVYDALYLALAFNVGATLFTADTKLASVARTVGNTGNL